MRRLARRRRIVSDDDDDDDDDEEEVKGEGKAAGVKLKEGDKGWQVHLVEGGAAGGGKDVSVVCGLWKQHRPIIMGSMWARVCCPSSLLHSPSCSSVPTCWVFRQQLAVAVLAKARFTGGACTTRARS